MSIVAYKSYVLEYVHVLYNYRHEWMARVTVEDCLSKIPNKFELVLLASKRAKDIDRGATPSILKNNDKSTVIALREISEETISLGGLREIYKKSLLDEDEGMYSVRPDEEALEEQEELVIDESEDEDESDLDDEESFEEGEEGTEEIEEDFGGE